LITELNPINAAGQLLKRGEILAIKGLGGFLLACDATNDTVVKKLRQRKKRPSKPFAIMVTDTDQARKHCYVSPEEEDLLNSPQSPIVLMKWREESPVSREVAPHLRFLGVMLPYTPLHHILLRDTGVPLVMTSGNLSEEPIAKDNDEALRRLSGIADYFLVHNRDICSRYDDSVAMIERGTSQLVRRARSYAPYPIQLPFEARQVLGCGAEEKNTLCLTRDNHAFLSQHIGDMENIETLEHFDSTLSLYRKLFRLEPEIVAHDLHPDYLVTRYARDLGESGIKLVPVQHHHAHIASCMADNGLKSTVIGVAFDGTGMGADGSIWGGEFLVADYRDYRRVGRLEYLPLPGGAAAIKRPYRTAIGYVLTLLGEDALSSDLPVMREAGDMETEIIKRQMERGINTPLTSSVGRLFDAVSALLGIRGETNYEGQAAVELEMAAYEEDHIHAQKSYPYCVVEEDGIRVVHLRDLLVALMEDLNHDVSKGNISVKFHNTIARMIDEMCRLTADDMGIKQVTLSGGVFQNRLLLKKTTSLLESSGFRVFTHRQVPCNDGGISLGQAVVANFTG
jgi:hydrogenase maturation protein HypF